MPTVTTTVHKYGLAPLEAVRAYAKNQDEGMSLDDIIAEGDIVNYQGDVLGKYALWSAIKRVRESTQQQGYPTSNYSSCGGHKILSDTQTRMIVSFVKTWRHKRFCTCDYIRRELRLPCCAKTVNNVLNEHGHSWKTVPKIQGLSQDQLKAREAFVTRYLGKPDSWWRVLRRIMKRVKNRENRESCCENLLNNT